MHTQPFVHPGMAYILAYELYRLTHGGQHPIGAISLVTLGGITYWHATPRQLPDLVDAYGQGQSLHTPGLQADYITYLLQELGTMALPSMNYRHHNLEGLLTPSVIEAVNTQLTSKGYASGEAVVRGIARDCTSSNHLKDLIWQELLTQLQAGVAQAYITNAANAPAHDAIDAPPAKARRK